MCCQPLCFIFFSLASLAPFTQPRLSWGSRGWLRWGETEEWSSENPRVLEVGAVPPGDEVELNWFVNVEPSGTERWASNLFSFLRGEAGWITRTCCMYSVGFYDISLSSFSLTFGDNVLLLWVSYTQRKIASVVLATPSKWHRKEGTAGLAAVSRWWKRDTQTFLNNCTGWGAQRASKGQRVCWTLAQKWGHQRLNEKSLRKWGQTETEGENGCCLHWLVSLLIISLHPSHPHPFFLFISLCHPLTGSLISIVIFKGCDKKNKWKCECTAEALSNDVN